MVSTYGGLTFVIPYIICVVLIGSTGVMEEFALGRWAGAGPVGAFGKCTGGAGAAHASAGSSALCRSSARWGLR